MHLTLILCREASFDEATGLFDVKGGGASTIVGNEPAGAQFSIALLIWMVTETTSFGRHRLQVEAVGPDGESLRMFEMGFHVPAAPSTLCEITQVGGYLAFGEYELRASVDGQRVATSPLSVVRAPISK